MVSKNDEVDGFEESARIVEAFSEGEEGDVLVLLAEIAQATRGRAINA